MNGCSPALSAPQAGSQFSRGTPPLTCSLYTKIVVRQPNSDGGFFSAPGFWSISTVQYHFTVLTAPFIGPLPVGVYYTEYRTLAQESERRCAVCSSLERGRSCPRAPTLVLGARSSLSHRRARGSAAVNDARGGEVARLGIQLSPSAPRADGLSCPARQPSHPSGLRSPAA